VARNVYSTQFIRSNPGSDFEYTCPEGFVALISTIDVYIGIVTDGGNFTAIAGSLDTVFWSQGYSVPGEQYSAWRGKCVLTPGESLSVYAGDDFACSVAGDLLTLP
jgi:hypothetical protein